MFDHKTDTFNFWIPAEMVKADPKLGDGVRRIRGLASTDHRDLQGEVVDIKGIDLSYFKNHGILNDNHSQETSAVIGEPTSAKITSAGLEIEGIIYKGKESADRVWEHMNALELSKASRKMGLSIEGKIVSREGSKIKRCFLRNIAVTYCPVNTHTYAEIAKSLAGAEWVDGSKEEADKAMTTANAGALVPESLEGNKNPQIYKSFDEVPDGMQLSYEQVVQVLQLEKGYSRATAQCVADVAFLQKGIR